MRFQKSFKTRNHRSEPTRQLEEVNLLCSICSVSAVLLLTLDLEGYKEKVIFLYGMEIHKEEVRQHFAC